jgi:hypothetical protein
VKSALSSGEATDVRRCARCGQATLVCVREWQHRIVGITTQTRTLDLACRSCGTKVTLHPHTRIAAERLFACLMIPAVFPSLFFFASAARKARAWTDNPVVGSAPHVPSGPRRRQCLCASTASCERIFQRRMQGIPVGTRYEFRCERCGSVFTVHDAAGIVFSFVAAAVVSAVAVLLVAVPPGSAVGAERSNQWFGFGLAAVAAFAWVSFGLQLRTRAIHPELTA